MKSLMMSIAFGLLINITMAQFPSFRASDKYYSPVISNDEGSEKFGDSIAANKVVSIYKKRS